MPVRMGGLPVGFSYVDAGRDAERALSRDGRDGLWACQGLDQTPCPVRDMGASGNVGGPCDVVPWEHEEER
ncbi:hypothetical protein GCM10010249_50360 [Streptomyces roseolilacinus]|uniref:Uncharacterized protein n=1 Tax=Streptomyces roseolilacinus TaxID=66904 RepID=A0A918ENK7_9ACTN|nr:hypothetical protein GCM10010249_50360 [Streptomyces roseolilacinus]